MYIVVENKKSSVVIAAKQARKAHQRVAFLPVSKYIYIYIHRGRDRMVV